MRELLEPPNFNTIQGSVNFGEKYLEILQKRIAFLAPSLKLGIKFGKK
jgi:hypothetical protein